MAWLSLLLFLPWFCVMGALYWWFPRQPRHRTRTLFRYVAAVRRVHRDRSRSVGPGMHARTWAFAKKWRSYGPPAFNDEEFRWPRPP